MKRNYNFFQLRYPLPVADICSFLDDTNGIFVDLPLILPIACKKIEYKNADYIIYENSAYLKINEKSQIFIKFENKANVGYWGVFNISNTTRVMFLFWINSNDVAEDVLKLFYENNEFHLFRDNANESYTALWTP